MKNKNTILYWVATIWLSLGMSVSGVMQIMQPKEELEIICDHLGYPAYFLTIMGVWKILGVIVVLLPKFPLIKEWAYAGFFFVMSGALISHIKMNDALSESFGPILLIVLTITSWYFRPADRKIIS